MLVNISGTSQNCSPCSPHAHNICRATETTSWYSLESKFPLNELLKLVCSSTCGFDIFGFCVDQMILDEVQACFNIGIFKFDKV